MEMQDETHNQNEKKEWQDWYNKNHPPAGRILSGLILVGVAVVLFMEKMGYYFPSWLFTWKAIVITIGLFIGAKQLFRGFSWLIPILIGSLFLASDLIPGFAIKPYIWPIIIFIIGLFIIFRPKKTFCPPSSCQKKWHRRMHMKGKWEQQEPTDFPLEGRLDAAVVFGVQKKKHNY